jgi:hypothetical protein
VAAVVTVVKTIWAREGFRGCVPLLKRVNGFRVKPTRIHISAFVILEGLSERTSLK